MDGFKSAIREKTLLLLTPVDPSMHGRWVRYFEEIGSIARAVRGSLFTSKKGSILVSVEESWSKLTLTIVYLLSLCEFKKLQTD
jgi:hypothetical protein